MNDDERRKGATALIVTGIVIGAIPFLCLPILVISTGHSVQPGGESVFFGAVYLGFVSGICLVPLGLVLFVTGIVRLSSKPKPPE